MASRAKFSQKLNRTLEETAEQITFARQFAQLFTPVRLKRFRDCEDCKMVDRITVKTILKQNRQETINRHFFKKE